MKHAVLGRRGVLLEIVDLMDAQEGVQSTDCVFEQEEGIPALPILFKNQLRACMLGEPARKILPFSSEYFTLVCLSWMHEHKRTFRDM